MCKKTVRRYVDSLGEVCSLAHPSYFVPYIVMEFHEHHNQPLYYIQSILYATRCVGDLKISCLIFESF